MGLGGTKNQTSSTNSNTSGSATTTLSPQVQAAYNSLLSSIGGNGSGTNAATNSATAGLGSLAANSNPAYASAAGTLGSAATPAYASISNYLSPYLSGALQAQIASQNQQNGQQQQQLLGNAIAQGSLGGNRVGVAQGQLAGQQALANNAANSGLINTAYQQAENAALQGQSGQTAAGSAQAGLGSAQTASSLSSLLGLLSAGSQPFSNIGALSGAASGLSNSGATVNTTGTSSGTSTQPSGNTLSALLGLGTSLAGLFSGGGVVPRTHYDVGGSVDELAQAADGSMQAASGISQQLLAAQQQAAQQQNQPMQLSDQEKKGVTNIKNWLTPANNNAPDASGRNQYRTGGVAPANDNRHGYDAGGFVDFPYSDYGDLNGAFSDAGLGATPSLPQGMTQVDNQGFAVAESPSDLRPRMVFTPPVDGRPMPAYAPSNFSHDAPSGVVPAVTPINQTAPRMITTSQAAPMAYANPSPVPLAPLPQPEVAPSGVVPATTGLSRADRNANPGNIVDSPWTRRQPGYVGSDGTFAKFDSPQDGALAMNNLLGNYANSGNNTIAGMISKWSPQSANAPGSTGNYINYVAQRTGIDPTQPIGKDQIPLVASAMSEFESGRRPTSALAAINSAAPQTSGVVPPSSALAFNSGAQGVIPNPGTVTGMPGGGIVGGYGQTPPGGYGVPDSNAGYSTNLRDVLSSLQAGKGLNLSPDARMALLSAGLGIMSGTSPNALTNIGTGAQQGLQTWQDKQKLNIETARANSDIGAQQGSLQQAGQQLYGNLQNIGAQIGLATAQTREANIEASQAGTSITPGGLGNFVKTVNPDGSISYGRLPFANVPLLGQADAPTGAPQSPAPSAEASGVSGAEQGDIPQFSPADFPSQVNTADGLTSLQNQGQQQFVNPAVQAATNARQLDVSFSQLAHLASQLPESGILTQGSGFNDRVGWANAANTLLTAVGGQKVVNPDDLATAEGVRKVSTQLQAALADTWKSDPAASTIAMAASGSPSGENTRAGLFDIVGNGLALNRRAEDRASFLNRWSGKNYGVLSGFPDGSADDYFNAAHPPQTYIAAGKAIGGSLAGKPVEISDPAVYAALPSGTTYLDADGKMRRKQ